MKPRAKRARWLDIPIVGVIGSGGVGSLRVELHRERVLVCGDRNWFDGNRILTWLELIQPTLVIHGAARGADTLAGVAARELSIPVQVFPALWDKHGRAAGPIRNRQMLREGKPTLVLGFHDRIDESRGTRDMLLISGKAGVAALLVSSRGAVVITKESFR